jgi:hypothetical protein
MLSKRTFDPCKFRIMLIPIYRERLWKAFSQSVNSFTITVATVPSTVVLNCFDISLIYTYKLSQFKVKFIRINSVGSHNNIVYLPQQDIHFNKKCNRRQKFIRINSFSNMLPFLLTAIGHIECKDTSSVYTYKVPSISHGTNSIYTYKLCELSKKFIDTNLARLLDNPRALNLHRIPPSKLIDIGDKLERIDSFKLVTASLQLFDAITRYGDVLPVYTYKFHDLTREFIRINLAVLLKNFIRLNLLGTQCGRALTGCMDAPVYMYKFLSIQRYNSDRIYTYKLCQLRKRFIRINHSLNPRPVRGF